MSVLKMTKGYARVVCENGHGIWGGETEEEAQKHVRAQCMECDSEPEENTVRYTPPRIIPATEADTLRAEVRRLAARVEELERGVTIGIDEIQNGIHTNETPGHTWFHTAQRSLRDALARTPSEGNEP